LCRTGRQSRRRQSAAPTCARAVRVTRPVGRWRHMGGPRRIARWPALVWRGLQEFAVAGATPPRWCGWRHRAQYGGLLCVPAWPPPG
jgi:hypothetical protein